MNHMASENHFWNPIMSEQEVKNEQIIKLSLKFYKLGSSGDSQETNIFTSKSTWSQFRWMEMSYVRKTVSILCEIKQRRGVLKAYICQLCFNGSLQTRIEDKTTSTIKSVQTQSTFIWQVVKAVAYKWNKWLSTEK